MNLLRAEVSRLAARRFVRLMVVLLLVAAGLAMVTTLASSHTPDAQELARASQQAAEERANAARYLAECRAAHAPDAPQSLREKYPSCEMIDPDRAVMEDYLDGVFVFDRQIKVLLIVLAAFLALFGFLVGASYVGAELASGGMTNLLLWRPQRDLVLGTKLAAVTGAVFAASVLATLLYVGAFWLIGQTFGLPGRVTADEWGTHGLLALRGIGVAVVATIVGFCVATLGRHTAAALGAAAAYAVVWEAGARIILEIIQAPRVDQWMLVSYLGGWLDGELSFFDRSACDYAVSRPDQICDPTYEIGWAQGGAVLAGLLVVAVAAAFLSFRRRDLA